MEELKRKLEIVIKALKKILDIGSYPTTVCDIAYKALEDLEDDIEE